jgi:hypothetical protein
MDETQALAQRLGFFCMEAFVALFGIQATIRE